MKRTTRSFVPLVAALAVMGLLAGACGDDSADTSSDTTAAEGSDTTAAEGTDTTEAGGTDTTEAAGGGDQEPGDGAATGAIVISGSSTVEPISALVAEEFKGQAGNEDIGIEVSGPGTGDGFELFCAGETDISDASRAIDEEEIAACEAAGIEFVEIQVGIDGLTVLTNPANEAVACLDNPALYALVGPESTGFSNWSDANELAAELESAYAELPDAPLDITAPGEESGTYDSFVEFAIEEIAEERGEEAVTRPDYTSSPNDNVIVEGIEGSESSFGWVGFAFFKENADQLKAIDIAGEDGTCVTPTDETIASGEYPFSRPLFIYVNVGNADESNPVVADFVDFYMSEAGYAAVAEAGYVQLTEEAWDEQVQKWNDRETGASS